jgi:hypothetical protein
LETLANEVAGFEGTENEDLLIKEVELEQMQIRLQLAVTSAGEIWNSAYGVLKVAMAEKELAHKRAEAREKVVKETEKAAADLKHKEESKQIPTLQFFRSLKTKAIGANEDDIYLWSQIFIRTLLTSAIKPWRWPAAMDSCLGDVHRKWLLKKVPIVKRNEISTEASFRHLMLEPFIKQIEGVLGEAENYRSLRYLKQLDTWSVAFYTERVVQLHQKLQIPEEECVVNTVKFLDISTKYKLIVNQKKSRFVKKSVTILGYIQNGEGIKIHPSKVKAIVDWERPTTGREVRSFMGTANWPRKLVKDIAIIGAPLDRHRMAHKVEWNDELERSFNGVKKAIVEAVTAVTEREGATVLEGTDASIEGLGFWRGQSKAEFENIPPEELTEDQIEIIEFGSKVQITRPWYICLLKSLEAL